MADPADGLSAPAPAQRGTPTPAVRKAAGKARAGNADTRHAPRLHGNEFDRLAGQTRLGVRARAMARMALVDGVPMVEVARAFDTFAQRVQLAVGSIHRVQAALTWRTTPRAAGLVPASLLAPLSDYVSGELQPFLTADGPAAPS